MDTSFPFEIFFLALAVVLASIFQVYVFLDQYWLWNKGICAKTGLRWRLLAQTEMYREYVDYRGNHCCIRSRWVDHPEERPDFLKYFLN